MLIPIRFGLLELQATGRVRVVHAAATRSSPVKKNPGDAFIAVTQYPKDKRNSNEFLARLLARPTAPRARRIFALEGFHETDQSIAFVGGDRLRMQQRIHPADRSRLIPTTSAKVEVNDGFE